MNDWVLLGPVIGIVGLIFFLLLLKPLSALFRWLLRLTGSVLSLVLINLLGLARGTVCACNDRPWASGRRWLALFLVCYGVSPLLTWDGPYCMLLGLAMMLTTVALWSRNMRLTRLLFLLNSPPVFLYNLIAGSYTSAAIEVAAFCSFVLAVWRFDIRPGLARTRRES